MQPQLSAINVRQSNKLRYQVKLASAERDAIAALNGQQIDSLHSDGISVRINTETSRLHIVPEEVLTPDAGHPNADVTRPMVCSRDQWEFKSDRVVGENLGEVKAVNILTTVVSFSPMVDCPPTEMFPGVVLPESTGYGWIYHPPGSVAEAEAVDSEGSALVELDVAIELVTECYPRAVVWTDLIYMVEGSVRGLPGDVEWSSFQFVRQPVT